MITPQQESPEIAKELGLSHLYLKREDLHPLGSHKGRSIPVMIDMKVAQGETDFVISSSGNAALAAVRHIQKRNAESKGGSGHLTLSIFIGAHINKEKLARLRSEITDTEHITIDESLRPLQALFRFVGAGKGGKASLRQSNDDMALIGYKTLAHEIAATPDLAAVFIGTSSGTTAQALADYLFGHAEQMRGTGSSRIVPAVHIVQTAGNSSLARSFTDEEAEPETSLADAIVDKVAHRRASLEESVRKTGGSGWIARNSDIKRAQDLLRDKAGIDATPNGALGLAGLLRALDKGARFEGAVVCIITGK